MTSVLPSYMLNGEWGLCEPDEDSGPAQPRSLAGPISTTSDIVSNASVRSTKHSDAGVRKYPSFASSPPDHPTKKRVNAVPRSENKNESFRSRISTEGNASSPRKQLGEKPQKNRSVMSFLEGDTLGELPMPSGRKMHAVPSSASSRKPLKAPAVPQSIMRPISGEISEWVHDYLFAAGLEWAIDFFKPHNFELHLVPYLDPVQVDDLLATSNIDPMDKIKLACALRAMKVQIQAQTQDETSRGLTRPASQSPLLENPDVVTWSVETVAKWFSTVPTLAHLSETFLVNNIDGKILLRLSDRKMLINLRLASPIDRRLLLQHISDLKSLQVSNANITHKDVVDKIVKGLGSELEHLRVYVPASPASTTSKKPHSSSGSSTAASTASSSSSEKKSPNFFLSLRISSKEIQTRVRELQDFVQDRIPALRGSKCILPPEQLHFTLGRLHLYSEEEQDSAKEVLDRCSGLVEKLYGSRPVTATFKGIANHGGNALFVETEPGSERDLLTELGNLIFEEFRDAGLASRNFRFIPVAPIIRIHTSKKEAIPPLKDLSTTLVPAYESDLLGKFTFESIEISCVSSETQENGYYKSLHSAAWGN